MLRTYFSGFYLISRVDFIQARFPHGTPGFGLGTSPFGPPAYGFLLVWLFSAEDVGFEGRGVMLGELIAAVLLFLATCYF